MSKIVLPGQHVKVDMETGVDPLWYAAFRQLEPLSVPQGGAAATLLGNPTGAAGPNIGIPLTTGLSFVGGALQGTSIDGLNGAFTFGYGITRTAQALRASLSSAFAALGADVLLNNTGNYFDGPKVTLGPGTWLVFGTVLVIDTVSVATIHCRLWDLTTVISSDSIRVQNTLAGCSMSVSGIITNPAADVRIGCQDVSATTGKILFNQSGNSKDSHITAIRIA